MGFSDIGKNAMDRGRSAADAARKAAKKAAAKKTAKSQTKKTPLTGAKQTAKAASGGGVTSPEAQALRDLESAVRKGMFNYNGGGNRSLVKKLYASELGKEAARSDIDFTLLTIDVRTKMDDFNWDGDENTIPPKLLKYAETRFGKKFGKSALMFLKNKSVAELNLTLSRKEERLALKEAFIKFYLQQLAQDIKALAANATTLSSSGKADAA